MALIVCLPLFLGLISPAATTLILSENATTYPLAPGNPKVISITENETVSLTLTGVIPTSRFVIIQVHAQHASLILTQTSPPPAQSESSSSIGMVHMLNGSVTDAEWTVGVVKGSVSHEDYAVSVLAVVQEYASQVPVPGGCNQVFALETDPNIRITPAKYQSQVWFQWARVGSTGDLEPLICEKPVDISRLKYEVYVAYTSETDDGVDSLFDTIRSVTTPHDMKRNAQKITTIVNDGTLKSLVTVTSQRGQGSVYGVVVTDTKLGLSASYVATASYACNYTAGDCSLKHDAMEWVLLVMCGAAGLVLLALGHNFLRTEMAVIGFMATAMISFTFLSMADKLSDEVRLGMSAGLGIIGGVGWLLVWVAFAFPSISVLLPGLSGGFLVAGALYFTPFANISWWATSLNYGLVFFCVTLLFPVAMLCYLRMLNIVSCSLVGGYCVIMVAAIPLRSSLRLLVLNVVRHAALSDYTTVLVVSPFLVNDIILTVVWATLTAAGIGWQFYRSRGKPHFPNQRRRRRRNHHHDATEDVVYHRPPPVDDERAPLLGNSGHPPSYNSSVNHPISASPQVNRPM